MPAVQALPALGSTLTPDLEGLVAVHPTGILVERDAGAALGGLSDIAPVTALAVAHRRRRGGVDRAARRPARSRAPGRRPRRAGPAPWPRPRPRRPARAAGHRRRRPAGRHRYVKRDSLHGQALQAAGYRNAVATDAGAAPSLTGGARDRARPRRHRPARPRTLTAPEQAAAVARWAALTPLHAVQEGRISVLAAPDVLSVGPAITTLPARLRAHLAP
ncbi:MAG: hypothetical protein R3F59_37325 [Myxococcota bacterium]